MHSGALTEQARSFLERRFARAADGSYFPHQPLHGLYGASEPGQPLRLARSYRLLRWLEALKPHSLADLGAAEGYVANLVRLRCGCPTLCIDLSLEACRRASELHGQPALASPLQRIPLADRSVDVVLLSEVFEHLENPLQVLCEMVRVARRYIVLTTQEVCMSRLEQNIRLRLRELSEPHGELNWLRVGDLHALFTCPTASAPQFRRSLRRLSEQLPRDSAGQHLRWLASPGRLGSEGVIFVASLDGSPVPELPEGSDDELWDLLIAGPTLAEPQDAAWQLADGRSIAPGTALDSGITPAMAIEVRTEALEPLDPTGLQRLGRLLDHRAVSHSPLERRLLSAILRGMERIGYLSSADPLALRLAWLIGKLRPARGTPGQIPESN
jgi:SAM-dependent methyltransferase